VLIYCKLVVQNQLIVKKDFNERSLQIDFIDFQSVPDEKFKLILNVQDLNTKFVCLRQYIPATSVAYQLLLIFHFEPLNFNYRNIIINSWS